MAFPTVASTSSGNSGGNATTHVMDLPSGVSSGDLLLLFVSVDSTPTASITTPASGWTELVTGTQVSSNRLSVFYRVADGSEAATLTITTSASEATSYAFYRITGHGSEVEASTAFNASTSDSPDPPSFAPSWLSEDTLWFAAASWDNGTISVSAYPANYLANQITDRFNSGGGAGVAAASRELAAASEDPGVFTLSAGDGVVAFTVAVRPSGGGGTPTGSGSITAIGTLSGVGTSTRSGTGSISAVGSLDGIGLSVRSGSGATNAIATLAGVGVSVRAGVGSITAIGVLSGVGEAPAVGAASGSGTITAIAALSGAGVSVRSGVGSIDAVGTLSGAGTAPSVGGVSGSGTILAIGTLAGVGTSTQTGSGSVSAIGAMSGVGTTTRSGASSVSAVATLAGVGSNTGETQSPAFLYYYMALAN